MKSVTHFFSMKGVALAEFLKRQIVNTNNIFTDVIIHDGGNFEIQMALAGYSIDLLDIEIKGCSLTISGKAPEGQNENRGFFSHGIARREFTRTLDFPQIVEAKEATFINGLLVVKLSAVVLESEKAQKVTIISW